MARGPWLAGSCMAAVLAAMIPWQSVSAGPARGYVISPDYLLQLTNRTETDQNFRLSVADFGSLDEEGGVAFLGQPSSELEHRYGLASWMKLERDAVFVAAGRSVQTKVMIDNRVSLAPGGHYGAVMATAVTDTGQPVKDLRVGIKQVLSSLVLIIKEGGAMSDLRLDRQSAPRGFWRLPSEVEQRFQNAGNIHLVPRGTLELKDPAGRIVKRAAINEGSQVILPESFRRYRTALVDVARPALPGRYTLVSAYRYDGSEDLVTRDTSFWYVGQLVVWIVAAAAFAGALVLAWWLWIRPQRKNAKKSQIRG